MDSIRHQFPSYRIGEKYPTASHVVRRSVLGLRRRFARSTQHLVNRLEELKSLGVDFISYTQQIDTTSSMGKFFFTIMAGIAEFESDIISERVKSGTAVARRNGKQVGRPRANQKSISQARILRASGVSVRGVAEKLRLSPATVQKYC